MKVSEITKEFVMEFGRILDDEESTLSAIMAAASSYIMSYTGLTAEQMDQHDDIAMVYLVLCCEMYDNRSMTVDNTRINPYVKTVLGMHSINLV